MPYLNTWETGGVVKRFWGFMDGRELAGSVEEIAASPQFDELKFIINDWLAVTRHNIDAAAVERVAVTRFGSVSTNPNIRVIALTLDPLLIAFADVETNPLLKGSHVTRAFATMDDARAWLAANPAMPIVGNRLRW